MDICNYCNQENAYVPISISPERNLSIYYCYPCSAEYVCWVTGGRESVHLYCKINNNLYRWSPNDYNELNIKIGRLWHIKEPGEPGIRANRKMTLLKSFGEDVPAINPNNIEEKIKLILLYM